MTQAGDSKGEYRGLVYRNDADLKAWLAKRPAEAALEPALPIIDPHVFFAITQGDNRNIMASQIAKHIFNVPRVICRIYDPLRNELYQTLGIETFSPTIIFADLLEKNLGA